MLNCYIIDIKLGNIAAIQRMLDELDIEVHLAGKPMDIKHPLEDVYLIVPGVGAWDNAIKLLSKTGWYDFLRESHETFRAIIGICLGMQVIFGSSAEGELKGLNLLDGEIDFALPSKKINIGWRDVEFRQKVSFTSARFYHVHRYALKDDGNPYISGVDENGCIVSIQHSNIYGFQFHPEKSHFYGKRLLIEVFKQL